MNLCILLPGKPNCWINPTFYLFTLYLHFLHWKVSRGKRTTMNLMYLWPNRAPMSIPNNTLCYSHWSWSFSPLPVDNAILLLLQPPAYIAPSLSSPNDCVSYGSTNIKEIIKLPGSQPHSHPPTSSAPIHPASPWVCSAQRNYSQSYLSAACRLLKDNAPSVIPLGRLIKPFFLLNYFHEHKMHYCEHF